MFTHFTILKRLDTKRKPYYAVRFIDAIGKVCKTVSLRTCPSKKHAILQAQEMLENTAQDNPPAMEYLLNFWTKDSDYARGRELRGRRLSYSYLENCRMTLRHHFTQYIGNRKLDDITPEFLEKVILDMSARGIGPRTINSLRQAILVPFNYRARLQRKSNPLSFIEKVKENPRKRGILTQEEIKHVIALEYDNLRVKAAFLLAALCGMRAGEIRGLQPGDVDFSSNTIHIQHNIVSLSEGIKPPKWNSIRTVPAPTIIVNILKQCRIKNPDSCYMLGLNESPIEIRTLKRGFPRILESIGINEEQRKNRNLCFHGLRHTFITLSRMAGIPDFVVMRMAGHKSMTMTESYSHYESSDTTSSKEFVNKLNAISQ